MPPFPDIIITHARLYDPVKGELPFTALAIAAGRIVALGNDRDVLRWKQPGTEVISANHHWVFPGFTDSHIHFLGYVKRLNEVELSDCRSLEETLQRIREKVAQTPEGEWITGGGWDYNRWKAGQRPHRKWLDEISTRHFIALESKDWHTLWVNTPVLQKAGIPPDRPYPGARHLAIDPDSREFTGVLEEEFRLRIYELIPPPDYDSLKEHFKIALGELHRLGVTAIHSMETPVEFAVYQEALRRGELPLRVSWYLPVKRIEHATALALQSGFGNEFLQIAGVKIFVDGAFGSQTAELFEPYRGLGHAGVEVTTREELEEWVGQAVRARLSCAIHAIGDRAVFKTLQVLGKFAERSRATGLRHRIEHVQLIRPRDMGLFSQYGIVASVQPLHLAADIPLVRKYLGERSRFSYPFGSLRRAGARLIFGSDAPIESFNPWWAIYTALERKFGLNAREKPFFAEERLTLEDALQAYTHLPQVTVGRGQALGRLQVGFRTDLFVSDRDVLNVPAEEVKATGSLLTMVDGKIVHRARE